MNENKNLEFIEIQVHGTKDKPYYEIHYTENGEQHIGYSSYNIKCVSDWLKEFFIKPVVHGHWIYGEDELGQDGYSCSECDFFVPWFYKYYEEGLHFIKDYHWCPQCGAKMDEEVKK